MSQDGAMLLVSKEGKAKQVAVGTIVGVEGDSSQFETALSMVSCFLLTLCQVLDGMWIMGHRHTQLMIRHYLTVVFIECL